MTKKQKIWTVIVAIAGIFGYSASELEPVKELIIAVLAIIGV